MIQSYAQDHEDLEEQLEEHEELELGSSYLELGYYECFVFSLETTNLLSDDLSDPGGVPALI